MDEVEESAQRLNAADAQINAGLQVYREEGWSRQEIEDRLDEMFDEHEGEA